jgi:transitional endoplasmic reticulum ATPase
MLCREAGMLALKEHITIGMKREELIIDRILVTREHFQRAQELIKPHLSKGMREEYLKMIRDFKG